jgi:hypothetical protein
MMIYTVESITRAHSTGSENKVAKIFLTLEAASDWLKFDLECICQDYMWPDSWDAEEMGGAAPPTSDLFNVSRLKLLLAQRKNPSESVLVWGPESNFELQRPVEIRILEMKMEE